MTTRPTGRGDTVRPQGCPQPQPNTRLAARPPAHNHTAQLLSHWGPPSPAPVPLTQEAGHLRASAPLALLGTGGGALGRTLQAHWQYLGCQLEPRGRTGPPLTGSCWRCESQLQPPQQEPHGSSCSPRLQAHPATISAHHWGLPKIPHRVLRVLLAATRRHLSIRQACAGHPLRWEVLVSPEGPCHAGSRKQLREGGPSGNRFLQGQWVGGRKPALCLFPERWAHRA